MDKATSGHACCSGRAVNVGDVERVASLVAGGGLALAGLRRLNSLSGVLLTLAGGGLVYRGVSGHCSLYQVLGMSRRAPQTGVPARHGSRIERSIRINAEPETHL